MPKLLVSVADPAEAILALDAGADLIDAKDPAAGALGALPEATIRAIVAAVAGRRTVTAVIGDHEDPGAALDAAARVAGTGVDMVKVGLFPGPGRARLVADLGRALAPQARLVGVLLADRNPDLALVPAAAEAGFAGMMLDTAGKAGGLLTLMGLDRLAEFVALARRHGLMAGLAGSLRVSDIDRLAPLGADLLGFRGGLCEGLDRRRPLRRDAVADAAARLGAVAAPRPAA
ncbi:(5-formylfuran-3-yl)methyl phosphate synthase [Prosthecomicrobium sp. N25]|uniref:(5-formylfuran-3-yl)methyl phosphate synthase n=1 Tax=Prosthecomicrobium sp. N25 TaxID=3129254 RepID=UPI00307898CA